MKDDDLSLPDEVSKKDPSPKRLDLVMDISRLLEMERTSVALHQNLVQLVLDGAVEAERVKNIEELLRYIQETFSGLKMEAQLKQRDTVFYKAKSS